MIAEALHRLQQIDEASHAKTQRLEEVEALLGESEALRTARARFVEAEETLRELVKRQRLQELELDSVAGKLQAEESRLYSGRVKNPKELAGLQKEVAYLKQRHAELEDTLLDTMVAREEAADRLAELKAELEEIEVEWEREQAILVAERDELRSAVAEARSRRAELVGQIPTHALNTYEYLLRTKGFAVAPVEKGMCTGCRVSLSAVDRQRVLGDELVTCGNCGRVLVVI